MPVTERQSTYTGAILIVNASIYKTSVLRVDFPFLGPVCFGLTTRKIMNQIDVAIRHYKRGLHAFNLYKPFMCRNDVIHLEGQYELYDDLIKTEDILDPNLYRYSKWSMFNIRYGIDSLKGTNSEVIHIGKWNMINTETKCRLTPSNKDEQVRGGDVLFENANWSQSFVGQTKSGYVTGKWVMFYQDWFKYDPRLVHRLVIVDPGKHNVFCADYNKLQYLVGPLFDHKGRAIIRAEDLKNKASRIKASFL